MRICVYASSSTRTSDRFMAAGRALGAAIAAGGHVLVNGGGRSGGMGALNEGCRAAGGRIVCVIHERFVVDGEEFAARRRWSPRAATGRRKRLLVEHCDALIVMPGGVGTLDELWDAASLQQLGFKTSRPVVLVNLDGYYDAAFAALQPSDDEGLTSKPPAEILHAVPDVGAALAWCEAQQTADAYTARASRVRARAPPKPSPASPRASPAAPPSRRSCSSGAGP
ncbi:lysine decarboxylase [Aureococcus anophagefferens]|uniref:Lysine decarboxylase n=1 Tax=Aureococcus anophagefferens TaxID=44056 RepID=A0ABR1FKD4_AURAN